MIFKKSLPLLATMLTSLSVAGCVGGGRNTLNIFEVPEGGFDTTEEVEIMFYHTMNKNLQDVLDAYIEDFESMYPNVTVYHRAIGGYDDVEDQMTKALSAGENECDIAYCYPDHLASYNKANAIIALEKLIDDTTPITEGSDEVFGFTSAQKDDFIDAYWEEGNSLDDGHFYCLPFSKSSEVMYYNKTFFEANNLKVPQTWDEMFEVCKQIKALDPNCIPLGYDSSSNLFITLTEQYKTGYTTNDPENRYVFNNAENKALIEKFAKFHQDGYMTTKTIYGSYTSGLFVSQDPVKSYISIGSTAGATNQIPAVDENTGKRPFEVGIAKIPQADLNNGKVISQGPDVCLFNSGDDQKIMASWLFVKYLTTSVEFQAQFSMSSGYTPVIKSVENNKVYADFLAKADGGSNLAALSTKTCLEQEDWYFTSPAFDGSSDARNEVGYLLDAVFTGTKKVDDAFLDAYNNCVY